MLDSAVRSLQTVTDQMPYLDALQERFPGGKLLEDCVIKIFKELIGLCGDCFSLYRRKWSSRFTFNAHPEPNAKTTIVNVATTPFTNAQQKFDNRADRVRDLFSQLNSYGLLAFYQTEERRYQTLLSEIRSSRPFQRTHTSPLISLPVDDKYITLPKAMDFIEECFSNAIKRSRQGRFAIYGMGGAGKTPLAACYARTRVDPKRDVFWIRARTEDTLNTDFGVAATDMDLENPESDTMSSVRRRDAVKKYLSHSAGRRTPHLHTSIHFC